MSRSEITDKGGTSKYKDGDKVRIISDSNTHYIKIGSIVTIKNLISKDMVVEVNDVYGKAWSVEGTKIVLRERDFELVEDSKSQPKEFIQDKWYKCINSNGVSDKITEGKYYRLDDIRNGDFWTTSLDGTRVNARFFNLHRFAVNSESDFNPDTVDPYKHTAYVKFKGYSGKYDSKEYCYKCDDSIVKNCSSRVLMNYASVDVNGEIKTVQIQRITKDYLDSKATKCIIGIVEDEMVKSVLEDVVQVKINQDNFFSKEMTDYLSVSKSGNNATTNVGDVNMSVQRKSVKVELFDNDQGLPVEYSLVGSWTDYVTEDSDGITVQEIISTGEVADLLQQHNAVRIKLIDEEILTRTGNSVNLRPIKLKNLTWMVDGRKVN